MPASPEIINPLRYPGWDELLLSGNDHEYFHTASWAAVLSDTYGYEPVFFINRDRGVLLDLIPFMDVRSRFTGLRGVSLPFTDSSSSILRDEGAFHSMFSGVLEEGRRRGWNYLELRGGRHIPAGLPAASTYLHHRLGLSASQETLFKACSENTRRNVRRAQQEGVSVSFRTGPDAVREFYRLHCLTRKRHGVPPPPFRFFENLRSHVLDRGHGTVALASLGGKVVASAVFLRFADRGIFKYGASDTRYEHARANHLVMWEGIRRLASEGCRELSFGRTDIGEEGLRRFKNSWGTIEEPLSYYRYDIAGDHFLENAPLRGRQGGRMLSRMPVFLLRAAGALLYRHIG